LKDLDPEQAHALIEACPAEIAASRPVPAPVVVVPPRAMFGRIPKKQPRPDGTPAWSPPTAASRSEIISDAEREFISSAEPVREPYPLLPPHGKPVTALVARKPLRPANGREWSLDPLDDLPF
jgi:hypothetical protein